MTHSRTGPLAGACGPIAAGEALSHQPNDLARYRRCEVCKEPGADTITRMFVADTGGDHTSYAHADCANVAGAGVITP
ncbi:hypothetical protein [Streptomyces melanogenes]|uniref:hypothetical protein n=1 Tax=Streptomyces melanogenes TaxID=67326 RepID=UPI00167E98B9|nr:hypothetical protein [Streptomyces melanogenes]GGP59405.1 hypothetical protein GCM10010278_40690 [Streptomyces melanogenes]